MEDFEKYEDVSGSIGYKCPGCGAPMQFDPATQSLKCSHCGVTQQITMDSNVAERSFNELSSTVMWDGDVKVVRCDNCGAKEVLQKNEISTRCPFCGSSSVLEVNELPGVKPDTAIPFKIGKKIAQSSCLKWLKSRFFAPSKFKKDVKINSLDGCYFPVWTFDCAVVAQYSGVLGKNRTETYYVNGEAHTRVVTDYFNVCGTIGSSYDDIYVKASDTVKEKYLQKLQPFDMNDYVKYDDKLLAGYSAHHYTVDPLDAWQSAEDRVRADIRSKIILKYNADVVQYLDINLQYTSRSFKYLMLPIYVSAVNYHDKLYNQYVNGVSGKVNGAVPLSPLKIGLTALVGIAAVVGIVLLLSML